MQRTPPRHLAPPSRPRPRARDHLLAESILALVAIGITTVILIGSLLDRPGIPPTPWLEAARALAAGDPLAAAEGYAAIGSRPDEADARLAAARLLSRQGHQAESEAQLAAVRRFLTEAAG